MSISLYDATIPIYVQLLGALSKLLDKAVDWVSEEGIAEDAIVHARLAPDMLDFAYQVKSAAYHSWGAIEGVRRGNFSPDTAEPPQNLAALKARVDGSIDALQGLDRAEVDGWVGQPMQFSMPAKNFILPFTAENFLFSFSLPNFHFHATTAYDLLRSKGMPIGKVYYLGRLNVCRDG